MYDAGLLYSLERMKDGMYGMIVGLDTSNVKGLIFSMSITKVVNGYDS